MKENSSQYSQLISTDCVSKTVSHFSSSQSHPKEGLNLVIDLEENKIEDLDRTITESDSDDNDKKVNENKKNLTSISKQRENSHEHGRWTQEEHNLFLEGLVLYGNEWKQVQRHIKSRSATQARSHAQKFFIKLKKMLSDEYSQEGIRDKICEIFMNCLGERFKPTDIESFLNMMQKLIFTTEPPTLSAVIEDKGIHSEKTTHKIRLPMIEKDEDDNNSIYSDSSLKQQIFSISKECSRKTSFNYPSKETHDTNLNKFSSIAKSIQSTTPSCINFVTINMVNNTKNNYVNQTVNEPLIQIPPQFNSTVNIKESQDSNPFNIQFDDLLGNTKNSGVNLFDEQYNYQGNSDFTSLLNMWN